MEPSDLSGLEPQLALERKKVDVASVSFSVRELVRMFEEGELSIAPSYQRKYRWSEEVASTFIESIFLGLPVPPVFVATNKDFQWEVVDGLQRISTLLMFLAERPEHLKVIHRDEPLKLKGLQKLSQLNGVSYSVMPVSLQRYFGRQALQIISLTDKSDRAVRFDLFERLNSGSISLTPQEVRSAVYRGQLIDFLEEMTQNRDFSSLLKLQQSNQHDGTAAEQVLKFFAYKNKRDEFDGAVKVFLNDYAASANKQFDYQREKSLFEETFSFLADAVGGPFLRKSTYVTPLVQFEACGVGIADILSEGKTPEVPGAGWIEDKELVASSGAGANSRSMLRRRLARARELFSGTP